MLSALTGLKDWMKISSILGSAETTVERVMGEWFLLMFARSRAVLQIELCPPSHAHQIHILNL